MAIKPVSSKKELFVPGTFAYKQAAGEEGISVRKVTTDPKTKKKSYGSTKTTYVDQDSGKRVSADAERESRITEIKKIEDQERAIKNPKTYTAEQKTSMMSANKPSSSKLLQSSKTLIKNEVSYMDPETGRQRSGTALFEPSKAYSKEWRESYQQIPRTPDKISTSRQIAEYNARARKEHEKLFKSDNSAKKLSIERDKLAAVIRKKYPGTDIDAMLFDVKNPNYQASSKNVDVVSYKLLTKEERGYTPPKDNGVAGIMHKVGYEYKDMTAEERDRLALANITPEIGTKSKWWGDEQDTQQEAKRIELAYEKEQVGSILEQQNINKNGTQQAVYYIASDL